LITAGLQPFLNRFLKDENEVSKDNALIIYNYIMAMKTEINLSDDYRKTTLILLIRLSRFLQNKSFTLVSRDNILEFLDGLRKPESVDPLHKWIGTYNLYNVQLVRFFKWLYSPDIEADKRERPKVVENIPKLRRKEKSIYRPSDLWTNEEDLFLRYCPSKRIKCYHFIIRDTACRPHEVLRLKVRDVAFKTIGSNHRQYAEILVNGKTGTRNLPLIDSIPYVKDYLNNEHPQYPNPNSVLICGEGKSLGRSIKSDSLSRLYNKYKTIVFPKLLESPNDMAMPCMHPHCIFDVFCVIGDEDDPIYLGLRF
jgi:integrase